MSRLEAGTVVDRKYEVVRPLGEGAMAHVYEATHRLTGREVALKVMNASYLRSPDAARRFLREVRLATELRHPNVVEVIDAGQDPESDLLYIAMERLRGEDLADRLVFKPKLAEALGWLLEMLPVLAMAHERGVVHRDLKPENTYLARNPDGSETVKLLDFGIARSLGGTNLTQTGMTLGTPIYMSPEQALRPQDVDHRADLWAFGVMLYEVVAGRPPFDDESPHALVLRAAAEPHEPLHEAAPGIPMRLSKLVDRCLEKQPEDRVATATEIETELAAILTAGDLNEARPSPSRPPSDAKTAPFSLAQEALRRFSDPPPKRVESAKTPAPGVLDSAQTLALAPMEPEAGASGQAPVTTEAEETPPRRRALAALLGVALLGAASGIAGILYADRTPVQTPAVGAAAGQLDRPTAGLEEPVEGVDPPAEAVLPSQTAALAEDEPDLTDAADPDADAPTSDAQEEADPIVALPARPNPRGRRARADRVESPASDPDDAPERTADEEPVALAEPAEPEPAEPEPASPGPTEAEPVRPEPAARPTPERPSGPSRPATTTRPRPRPTPTPAPAPDPSPPPFSFK